MKKYIFSLSLLAAVGFVSCNAQNKEEATEQTEQSSEAGQVINKDVDVAEFEKLVAAGGGLLLDVRTDGEFAEGHLKGATQIDYNSPDFQEKIKALNPETPVYVYCRSGGRSGNAANIMKGMGFKAVYNLEGGIMAWQGAGKPVEK